MFLSSPSCVFYLPKKDYLKKSHSKKLFSWRKQNFIYLLLSFAPSFFREQKLFSIFQLSFYFFLRLLCFSLSFSVRFFQVSLIFCEFVQTKNLFFLKNLFREIYRFFKSIFFSTFFWRREHILMQKKCSKIFIRIFKKKSPLKDKKNLFQDSHTLRIACALESPLHHCCMSWRSWASQVSVPSVVIDLGRGTSVASNHLSHFFCFSYLRKP